MANPSLTLACQNYDHTRALADGTVKVDGANLNVVNISPPSQIFLRMLNHEEFDVSEMSLSNYMIALANEDRRFVALPVFPSRVFRHSYVWINTRSGIERPQDLKGKRVGIADYAMTALLFTRGFLTHQYGVRPEDIHWFRRRREHVSIAAPAGIRIDNIGRDETLDDLLEQGNLDAVALTQAPRGFVQGAPNIRRLFSDARSVEAEYYRRDQNLSRSCIPSLCGGRFMKNSRPSRPRLPEAVHGAKGTILRATRRKRLRAPLAKSRSRICPSASWVATFTLMASRRACRPWKPPRFIHTNKELTKRKLDVSELFAPETLDLFGE